MAVKVLELCRLSETGPLAQDTQEDCWGFRPGFTKKIAAAETALSDKGIDAAEQMVQRIVFMSTTPTAIDALSSCTSEKAQVPHTSP